MMRRSYLGGLIALCAANPAFAEPISIAPSSEWHVDYAVDSCRLARIFGERPNRAILMIDRFEPRDSFQLLVASTLLTRLASGGDSRKVTVRFGPGEDEQSHHLLPAKLEEMPALMIANTVLGVRTDAAAHQAEVAKAKAAGDKKALKALAVLTPAAPVTPAREAAVTHLEIAGASRNPIVLQTGPLAKPMAALRACTDELITHWGIDAESHRSLSRKALPKGNPGEWVYSHDYPIALKARGVQGLIQFRLMIGEGGEVTDCHIQQATRPADFDKAVCAILTKRGRFEPALDAAGKPIKSYWRSSFRFQMQ